MNLLECKNLTKTYGKSCAIDNINLEIPKGRIIGVFGINGAGKSTFFKLINQLLIPTEGEILFKGEKLGIKSKERIAYLPERSYLNNSKRIKDVLKYFDDFYDNFNLKKAYKLLDELKLDSNMQLYKMSKGMLTKFNLILVISRDADLYILDEPLDGVDPSTRDYIIEKILSNVKNKSSMLISTHMISDIEKILDDVIFLDRGRIVLSSPREELVKKEKSSVDEIFRRMFRC